MFKKAFELIKEVSNDTLKRDGKWSRTSLTMATAWWASITVFLLDFFKNGFNEFAFGTMVAVALGSKISDALSNKLNK